MLFLSRLLVGGINDVDKVLYEKIVQTEAFDNTAIGEGIFVIKDTYRLQTTLTCLAANHMAWTPTDTANADPVCGEWFMRKPYM